MEEKTHALLSPSSSERWLNCTKSARACEGIEDETSEYALAGTDCHSLCEYKLKKELGLLEDDKDIRPTLKYYDEEMEECSEAYKNYVLSEFNEMKTKCPDAKIFIEEKVRFDNYIPDGMGTSDAILIGDKELEICDYKHGQGVVINPEHNTQFMIYALGALNEFDGIYDIETIKLTVIQPRRENIKSWSISKAELISWGENVLKPRALEAFNDEGTFKASEWCRFCKIRATCKHRMEYLIKHDFEKKPDTLCEEEFIQILSKADLIQDYLTDVKEYALNAALKGKKWNGYKLVESRTTRHFTDEKKVASVVKDAGVEPYEMSLKNITTLTKELGKSKFNDLLSPYLERSTPKSVLVKESDPRPEINDPKNDFK